MKKILALGVALFLLDDVQAMKMEEPENSIERIGQGYHLIWKYIEQSPMKNLRDLRNEIEEQGVLWLGEEHVNAYVKLFDDPKNEKKKAFIEKNLGELLELSNIKAPKTYLKEGDPKDFYYEFTYKALSSDGSLEWAFKEQEQTLSKEQAFKYTAGGSFRQKDFNSAKDEILFMGQRGHPMIKDFKAFSEDEVTEFMKENADREETIEDFVNFIKKQKLDKELGHEKLGNVLGSFFDIPQENKEIPPETLREWLYREDISVQSFNPGWVSGKPKDLEEVMNRVSVDPRKTIKLVKKILKETPYSSFFKNKGVEGNLNYFEEKCGKEFLEQSDLSLYVYRCCGQWPKDLPCSPDEFKLSYDDACSILNTYDNIPGNWQAFIKMSAVLGSDSNEATKSFWNSIDKKGLAYWAKEAEDKTPFIKGSLDQNDPKTLKEALSGEKDLDPGLKSQIKEFLEKKLRWDSEVELVVSILENTSKELREALKTELEDDLMACWVRTGSPVLKDTYPEIVLSPLKTSVVQKFSSYNPNADLKCLEEKIKSGLKIEDVNGFVGGIATRLKEPLKDSPAYHILKTLGWPKIEGVNEDSLKKVTQKISDLTEKDLGELSWDKESILSRKPYLHESSSQEEIKDVDVGGATQILVAIYGKEITKIENPYVFLEEKLNKVYESYGKEERKLLQEFLEEMNILSEQSPSSQDIIEKKIQRYEEKITKRNKILEENKALVLKKIGGIDSENLKLALTILEKNKEDPYASFEQKFREVDDGLDATASLIHGLSSVMPELCLFERVSYESEDDRRVKYAYQEEKDKLNTKIKEGKAEEKNSIDLLYEIYKIYSNPAEKRKLVAKIKEQEADEANMKRFAALMKQTLEK